ncbi:hypothetical protein HMPREF1425_00848 [Helicobacter pylori GAM71Ai]|uniref:Uncharacterized protein n=1 Tax=Helicobacter pylori GAM260BSi TaxID=1159046 RepID=M3PUI9_HELPX|nr:hypothetical protein HMPREF1418_00890 [Helicobacter pylori GAM260BSi]EMH35473.1 hypothetical protein HMPREF1425_00848 [Helicobacter pylori GAM71Ai]EMH68580.1 hypothetical protein HMPREF1451_00651 [Helicobacter pylori HP260BFii]EMJ43119.1 hypothetical protein HMPREF1436_01284 [Helicobacter pylori GAMchJs136i]
MGNLRGFNGHGGLICLLNCIIIYKSYYNLREQYFMGLIVF